MISVNKEAVRKIKQYVKKLLEKDTEEILKECGISKTLTKNITYTKFEKTLISSIRYKFKKDIPSASDLKTCVRYIIINRRDKTAALYAKFIMYSIESFHREDSHQVEQPKRKPLTIKKDSSKQNLTIIKPTAKPLFIEPSAKQLFMKIIDEEKKEDEKQDEEHEKQDEEKNEENYPSMKFVEIFKKKYPKMCEQPTTDEEQIKFMLKDKEYINDCIRKFKEEKRNKSCSTLEGTAEYILNISKDLKNQLIEKRTLYFNDFDFMEISDIIENLQLIISFLDEKQYEDFIEYMEMNPLHIKHKDNSILITFIDNYKEAYDIMKEFMNKDGAEA